MKPLPTDWSDEERGLETLMNQKQCPPHEQVLASMEGVLPELLQRQIEDHVAGCRLCQMLRVDLTDSELSNPNGAEKAAVLAKVEQQAPARGSFWGWMWKPALGIALAGLAVLLFLVNQTKSPVTPVVPKAPEIAQRKSLKLPVEVAAVKLPLDAAIIWRGAGEEKLRERTYMDALGVALEPYRAGRFEEAAAALEAVEKRFSEGAEASFYRGVSLLLAGREADAVSVLERTQSIAMPVLRPDVDWYLAVARQNSGKTDEAMVLLRELCSKSGEHQQQACAGVQAIEKP